MINCNIVPFCGMYSRNRLFRYTAVEPRLIAIEVSRFLNIKMRVLESPTKWNLAAQARRMAYQIMKKYNQALSRDEMAQVFNRKGSGVFTAEDQHQDAMKFICEYRETFLQLEAYIIGRFGFPRQ